MKRRRTVRRKKKGPRGRKRRRKRIRKRKRRGQVRLIFASGFNLYRILLREPSLTPEKGVQKRNNGFKLKTRRGDEVSQYKNRCAGTDAWQARA